MLILLRNWWALAVRGVLGILFAVVALAWPAMTIEALVLVFGAYAIADGLLAVVAAAWAAGGHRRWGALVFEGAAGIFAGALAFFWPHLTAFALLVLIAGWFVATGVFELAAAVRLRRDHDAGLALGLCGALSVGFGLFLAIFPRTGALALLGVLAAFCAVLGVLFLWLAIWLRTTGHRRPHRPTLART